MPEDASGAGRSRIAVNQVGYFPPAPKYGMKAGDVGQCAAWALIDVQTDTTIAAGMTSPAAPDQASGDAVQTADFSAVTAPGTYVLEIDGLRSTAFRIGTDLYGDLKIDAARYFYLNRSGIALEKPYAGRWARPAGHLSDDAVTCYRGVDADGKTWDGCDYTLDVRGGWYDAGDYGKYVVNAGITVWTLLNLYERLPDAFPDGSLNIPESGNSLPDLLDEVRWELDFLLAMQVPPEYPLAGMAHHKLHDLRWSGIPVMPPERMDNTAPDGGRYLYPPSTAATLNLAAAAAQAARVWREIDLPFAARCLNAAEIAWQSACDHPDLLAGNTPGAGGGNYEDRFVDDEFYWAAAELFITTGRDAYRAALESSPYFLRFPARRETDTHAAPLAWGDTAALGTISLAMVPNMLPSEQVMALRAQVVAEAERCLRIIDGEGYRVPLSPDLYFWGSTSDVLNEALILALAHDFTGEGRYLAGVTESMDYLLGRNALGFSFVSGYGACAMQHPHHRFWANQPEQGFPPPPPGALSGGPNARPTDPTALNGGVMALGPARRYVDHLGSWSTNEVAINWNAPLVWVAAYLDAHFRGNIG